MNKNYGIYNYYVMHRKAVPECELIIFWYSFFNSMFG